MMHERDENRLDEEITRVVRDGQPRFDADEWKQQHPDAVRVIESWKTASPRAPRARGWQGWRNIMHGKVRKAIAAAVVAAAVVLGVIMIGGRSSAKLFAEAIRQIRAAPYTFTLSVKSGSGKPVSGTAMVPELGKLVFEYSSGSADYSAVYAGRNGKYPLHLFLCHHLKIAYDGPRSVRDAPDVPRFLAMLRGPAEALWNLKDNQYEELGHKKIDGQPAKGFRVVVKSEHERKTIQETISVWAHAKTGKPLIVVVAFKRPGTQGPAMEFVLTDFEMNVELDKRLLSTEVPEGYILAHQTTLRELPAGDAPSAEADKILRIMSLWSGGNKQEAVGILLKVDWAKEIRFAREAYLFTLTEREFTSLIRTDQNKVMPEIVQSLNRLRYLAKETLKHGRESLAAHDTDAAENHFTAVLRLGRLLNRKKDSMLVVRLVSITIREMALDDLAKLYRKTGQKKKLEATQAESRRVKATFEKIKRNRSRWGLRSAPSTPPPTRPEQARSSAGDLRGR